MDLLNNNFNHARSPSLGYGEAHVRTMTMAQSMRLQGTSQMAQCKEGPSKDNQSELIRVDAFVG